MTAKLASLLGDKLLAAGAAPVGLAEALAGKKVCLLYFSAHWCPPCRGFTPKLAEAYKEYRANGGSEAEVVFVSWDRDDAAFSEYFAEMPWLALPFEGTQDLRNSLGEKFGVEGIPALVALDADGELLHGKDDEVDLRQLVSQHKAGAFPMSPERVSELKRQEQEQARLALEKLGPSFPPLRAPGGAGTSLQELLEARGHLLLLLGDGDSSDGTYADVAAAESKRAAAEGGSFAVVYLGWSLYNESCSHGPFAEKHYSIADLEPSEELKATVTSVCSGKVGPPHAVLLGRGESGQLVLVANDPGCQRLRAYGSVGFPWSDERVQELKASAKARVEALKGAQVNLQFLKADGRDGLSAHDGTERKVDDLSALGGDAVVGLYFSAHWCPPCRGFTPELAKCYEALRAEGKTFEVVFLSSDQNEDAFKEYFAEMPWLALPFAERALKEDLSKLFEVNGIPALILLKPDGSVVTTEGRMAVDFGAEYFPWREEDLARGKAEAQEKARRRREEAVVREREAVEEQEKKGVPALRRLRGAPGTSLAHSVAERTLKFEDFATAGVPGLRASGGVLYYEVELLPGCEGIPQFGFAVDDFEVGVDEYSGEGVGDDANSWGVDGKRQVKWNGGDTTPWACPWRPGDVIGLAANIDAGKIAVSKKGDWAGPCGVVFEDEKIKTGAYPALTATGWAVRYSFGVEGHGALKHEPPSADVWGA